MKLAKGQSQDGIVIGNSYDKYDAKNPVARRLIRGFDRSLSGLVETTAATSIHEVGCGEGYWTIKFAKLGKKCRGSDFSSQVIAMARSNAQEAGADVAFEARSIYDLSPPADVAELILCCEVLEHLEHPQRAIDALAAIANPYLIASVPREPIWSLLNMARGKYLSTLGNTTGHLQRWSTASFVRMLRTRFTVEQVLTPLPWTMVLARVP